MTFHPADDALGADGGVSSGVRGATGHLSVGTTLTPTLRVGLEWTSWAYDAGPGDDYVRTNVIVGLTHYPLPNRAFFVRGGLGLAHLDLFGARYSGLGAVVGVGSDVPLAGPWYLTATGAVLAQAFRDRSGAAAAFALGVTWR